MPHPPEIRKHFGYHWRKVTRPRILERSKGRCERCTVHAKLEVAHLVIEPGQPGHDDDENLAALCVWCHKAHDYPVWSRKCYETRCARKDAARPLLGATP